MAAAGIVVVLPDVPISAPTLSPVVVPPPVPPLVPGSFGLRTLQVTFPNGTKATIQGYFMSQYNKEPIDGIGLTDFTFKPSGPMIVEEDKSPAPKETTLLIDGKEIGALTDISMPTIKSDMIDITRDPAFTGLPEGHREYVAGIRRMSDLTFTCEFNGKECLL